MSVKFNGRIGYGAMGLTLNPNPVSEEQAFEVLKIAIENGAGLINTSEFYGLNPREANLILLNNFFTKYPELRSKVKLSCKGAMVNMGEPDCSKEGVTKSIENTLKYIDHIDIYECARVDPNVPIEDTISYLKEFVEMGKIGGISLSETNANTIKRANKIYPISFVEVEFSLFVPDILHDGVYQTCLELGIPILAYSPLGLGFLSGKFLKFEDTAKLGPFREVFQKFNDESIFNHNVALAKKIEEMSSRKGVTMAQFALAWVISFDNVVPIPGSTNPSRVLENMKVTDIKLTDEEFKEIDKFLENFQVKGYRYNLHADKFLMQ